MDGMIEEGEWRAGTDPKDPGSRLAFERIERHTDGFIEITWASVPDLTYRLEYRAGIDGGWTEVDRVTAVESRTTRRHTPSETVGHGFYRLQLQP